MNVHVLEGLSADVSCQNLFCSLNGGCEAAVMAAWLRMKCLRENTCFGRSDSAINLPPRNDLKQNIHLEITVTRKGIFTDLLECLEIVVLIEKNK